MKTLDPTEAVSALFKRRFGYTPTHLVRAPGQLEVLGSDLDGNDGLVMSVAVNRCVHIASAPRTDGRIELAASAFPDRERFWTSTIEKNPAAPWADDVKGVLAQLRKRGVHFSGFNAAIYDAIPMNTAMGGPAALAVAAALTVRRLYPFSLTETGATVPPKRDARGELPALSLAERMHFAKLCRAAENEFVGAPDSIVGPVSSLLGRAWHVINLDCRFFGAAHAPLPGETLVVCDTGVKPDPRLAHDDSVRNCCESAAGKLGARSLRSVELKHLRACKSCLTAREYECAHHFVGEIARVVAAERALREDDHRQFGQYLYQSHESARDFLKNSCPELDLLVELARAHSGCLGARLTGGRPGGATLNLVAHHQAEDFMETIARQYAVRTGKKLTSLMCQIVDGAD